MNLEKRVEKLEQARGVGFPSVIISVCFVSPEGLEPLTPEDEPLTPEETAALNDYKERLTAAAAPGSVEIILWTREKAQELLAGKT